jgi:tetratricopeptide (TPR) repeat protein
MAADGSNLQGVRLYQQGQFSSALQQFQQAISVDPTNADGYYNMAATLHKMGSEGGDRDLLNQAETLYNQCLDVNEDHVDCHRGLAVLLVETGRSDSAVKLLKNWSAANPDLAAPRIELGRVYEEFGDLETAKLHLNQALMLDQHNHRAWAALGRIRERNGDIEQALANYQRSYDLNTFQPGVADRIAALNRSLQVRTDGAVPGGTRTVTAPNNGQRF